MKPENGVKTSMLIRILDGVIFLLGLLFTVFYFIGPFGKDASLFFVLLSFLFIHTIGMGVIEYNFRRTIARGIENLTESDLLYWNMFGGIIPIMSNEMILKEMKLTVYFVNRFYVFGVVGQLINTIILASFVSLTGYFPYVAFCLCMILAYVLTCMVCKCRIVY